ncbi:MAG: DUF4184 family protein [Candidatus Thorarchaeota archaeon]
MPSSVFSHQAPGLALKIKYPNKFDGTALCISTMIPDINIFFDPFLPFNFRNFTHSLIGLILLTIPLTLLFTVIFCMNIGPFFAKIANNKNIFFRPLNYFGVDEWDNLKKKKFNRSFFVVASYSAFIGGLTHLLLDLPAHENIEIFFPLVFQSPDFLLYSIIDFGTITIGERQIERNLTVYGLIWIIETLITLVIALYLLRYIKKHKLIRIWYSEI